MSAGLTSGQAALLRYVAGHLEHTGGVSPTFEQCRRALGYSSRTTVAERIHALIQRGHLRHLPRRACSLSVVHPVPIPRAPDGAPLYAVPLPALQEGPSHG